MYESFSISIFIFLFDWGLYFRKKKKYYKIKNDNIIRFYYMIKFKIKK